MIGLVCYEQWSPAVSISVGHEQVKQASNAWGGATGSDAYAPQCLLLGTERAPGSSFTYGDSGTSGDKIILVSGRPSTERDLYLESWKEWVFYPPKGDPLGQLLRYWSAVNVRWLVADLGERAKRVVGQEGARRIQEFNLYKQGWDSGEGQPLSSLSLAVAETFLTLFQELQVKNPSVFLTRLGNLQLGWEDKDGNPIEVEFFPNKVQYYFGSEDEEGEIELDPDNPSEGLQKAIAKVRALCHE